MNRRDILYGIGRPLSPFYSLAMKTRERMYRYGVLASTRLDVPVVSVGNITLGGSGKTPVVEYIAGMLQERGWKPAVVSRGYRGSTRGRVNVVSDGRSLLLTAEESGDEPRLLAEKLPGVPVLTGPARKYPAKRAVVEGAGAVILDDGFQHLSLKRDVDLVLFNTDTLAGNSRVFPGGDLREPVSALNRCDAFLLTGVCQRNRERALRFADLLNDRFPGHPVFLGEYTPTALLQSHGSLPPDRLPIQHLAGTPLFAVAGIANPENFLTTLQDTGILHVVESKCHGDHHRYDRAGVAALCTMAELADAGAVVTTEKDMVKLRHHPWSLPLYALQMEISFGQDFHEFLNARLLPPPADRPAARRS